MTIDVSSIVSAALAEKELEFWKHFHVEAHRRYGSLPIWVLLYDDVDLGIAHESVRSVLSQLRTIIEPLKPAIFYTKMVDENVYTVSIFSYFDMSGPLSESDWCLCDPDGTYERRRFHRCANSRRE
ncbi:MAG: hypothetical protein AAGE83_07695 [Pseudomonadota bacterium]